MLRVQVRLSLHLTLTRFPSEDRGKRKGVGGTDKQLMNCLWLCVCPPTCTKKYFHCQYFLSLPVLISLVLSYFTLQPVTSSGLPLLNHFQNENCNGLYFHRTGCQTKCANLTIHLCLGKILDTFLTHLLSVCVSNCKNIPSGVVMRRGKRMELSTAYLTAESSKYIL